VQDSRLIQMREMAKECQTLAAEMLDESIRNPHDMLNVARAEKFAAALAQAVTAAYSETVCGDFNTVGSMCAKPAGHNGAHRSQYGAQWTEESNAISGQWMSKQMTGRD
jgi:hypothetical protein